MFNRPGSKNQTWRAGTPLIPVISHLKIQHDDARAMGSTMDTNHFFISIVYESLLYSLCIYYNIDVDRLYGM